METDRPRFDSIVIGFALTKEQVTSEVEYHKASGGNVVSVEPTLSSRDLRARKRARSV